MRLLSAIVLALAVAVGGTAIAKLVKISSPTVVRKSVTYYCQQGKHVTITYSFSRQDLTTFVLAVVDGRRRLMPTDPDRPGNADAYCGKEDGYVLNTVCMDEKTHCKQPIMITAPDGEIVLKDYSPR